MKANARPHCLRKPSGTGSPPRPPSGLSTRSKLESPRTPVGLSPKFDSIALSPLVDPRSALSLPESEHNRVRWLNRFTPRWNETREQRLARFRLRSQSMRTPRAHTERLLNSFQRLDAFTGTVLPSDFMISFSLSRWQPPPENAPPTPSGKGKRNQEDGPGTYLTPNRILHPYWVPKKNSMSIWILCHQDVLKYRKKLRSLYRYTQDPKFSPHLSDQVSSQLVRRIAQECVVLKHTLSSVPSSTRPDLSQPVKHEARSGMTAIMSDYPTSCSSQTLLEYVEYLLDRSTKPIEVGHQTKPGKPRELSATLGGIIVMSSNLFQRLLQPDSSKDVRSHLESTQDNSEGTENQHTLMFSLSLPAGPVPVWDLGALLQVMAKEPPRKLAERLITAETDGSAKIPEGSNLTEILKHQIEDGLNCYSKKLTTSCQSPEQDQDAYLVPLTEATYPLILSLRRATWWLGQGFELKHFSDIDHMVQEASDRKEKRQSDWLDWLRNRNSSYGKITEKGRLFGNPTSKSLNVDSKLKIWKRV